MDNNLAIISSFLTFDGHLHKDLKGFYLSSSDVNAIDYFKEIVNNEFNIYGVYREDIGYKKTIKYRIFNKKISEYLFLLGVPRGNKVLTKFSVPEWIKSNKELTRQYLKIAFYCEGSFKENNRKNARISFTLHKSENILDNGISFMEQIRNLLKNFDIRTTPIYVSKGNTRKDGIVTKMLRFRVITEDNNKFINEIGWMK